MFQLQCLMLPAASSNSASCHACYMCAHHCSNNAITTHFCFACHAHLVPASCCNSSFPMPMPIVPDMPLLLLPAISDAVAIVLLSPTKVYLLHTSISLPSLPLPMPDKPPHPPDDIVFHLPQDGSVLMSTSDVAVLLSHCPALDVLKFPLPTPPITFIATPARLPLPPPVQLPLLWPPPLLSTFHWPTHSAWNLGH